MNKTIEALKSLINLRLDASFEDVSQMSDLIAGLEDDLTTLRNTANNIPTSEFTFTELKRIIETPTPVKVNIETTIDTTPKTADGVIPCASGRKGIKHMSHKGEVPKITEYVVGLGRKIYLAEDLINKVASKYKTMDKNFIRRVIKQLAYVNMTSSIWRYDQTNNTVYIGKEES